MLDLKGRGALVIGNRTIEVEYNISPSAGRGLIACPEDLADAFFGGEIVMLVLNDGTRLILTFLPEQNRVGNRWIFDVTLARA